MEGSIRLKDMIAIGPGDPKFWVAEDPRLMKATTYILKIRVEMFQNNLNEAGY